MLISFHKNVQRFQSQDRLSLVNMTEKDPLPTTTKFCFYFDLKPAVTCYILVEYIVWILFLLSALNLEIECLEKSDLMDFENTLRRDLYYNLIFGEVEPIPHENARGSVIFLNTVLCAIFFLYFIFTPLLLIGIIRVSYLNLNLYSSIK